MICNETGCLFNPFNGAGVSVPTTGRVEEFSVYRARIEVTTLSFLRFIVPLVLKCAKERRILVGHNTTVCMC